MNTLPRNIRFYILVLASVIAMGVFTGISLFIPASTARVAKITETYALLAASTLYLTLLISPLIAAIPRLPFKAQLIKSRRALGVSALLFALFHACFAFWGELGGFSGLPYLSPPYIKAIILSSIALLILICLGLTSFDAAVRSLGGKKWKALHKLVYVAAILIIIHLLTLGSDFSSPTSVTFRLGFIAVVVLGMLEAWRLDGTIQRTFNIPLRFGLVSLLGAAAVILGLNYFSSATSSSFSVHNHGTAATASETPAHVHFHANFALYINGSQYDFSNNKYMEPVTSCSIVANQKPVERVHLHNNVPDLIHIHSANVTWSDFFLNVGFALNNTGLITDAGQAYVNNDTQHLTYILNGTVVTNLPDTYIAPNDRLLINYGSESADDLLKNRFPLVANTAPAASATSDPASCSGS